MKKVRATIIREQHSELIVPDDFPIGQGWPPLSFDHALLILERQSRDSITTSIDIQLVEEDITE